MLPDSTAGLRTGPPTTELVLERLPGGELAWLRPEPEGCAQTDLGRRVAEHLDIEACCRVGFHVASHRGSPLVCGAIRSGRSVIVVQVYPGGDRGLERRLHNRHHPRICPSCRRQHPLQPRRIRIRRGVGRAHGPPAHSPRLTARRGGPL